MKKIGLYIYIASIFMLANDALFNWFFGSVGLSFWRQAIWGVGMYEVYACLHSGQKFPYLRKVLSAYGLLFALLIPLSMITLLVDDFSILRILFTLIEYSYGIPFIFFPYICVKAGWDRRRVNVLFIVLGTFLTTGLLADFLTGGMFSASFRVLPSDGEFNYEMGKFTFLSTTDSIFTIYYSLCLICCFYEYKLTKRGMKKFFLIVLTVYFLFGSIFCGARQTLAALLIIELFGLLSISIKDGLKNSFILILGATVIVMALPYANNILSKNTGFQERYTQTALKEDNRTQTWKQGFDFCFTNTTPRRILIGDGVGLAHGRFAEGQKVGRHYENSFLATISEVGVPLALALLLLPIHYILKYRRRSEISQLYLGFALVCLFIGFVSPNLLSNQSQMTIFLALGLLLWDCNLENYEKTRPVRLA